MVPIGAAVSAWFVAGLSVLAVGPLVHAYVRMRRHGRATDAHASASFRTWTIVLAASALVLELGVFGKFWLLLAFGQPIETEAFELEYERTNNKGTILEDFAVAARPVGPPDGRVFRGEITRPLYDRIFGVLYEVYDRGDPIEFPLGDGWHAGTVAEVHGNYAGGVVLRKVQPDDPALGAAHFVREDRLRLPAAVRAERLHVPFLAVPWWPALHVVGSAPILDAGHVRVVWPTLLLLGLWLAYAIGRPKLA